ncbi:MAG: virion morphogenesis protein [Comamonadaceae bacterium]|nr:virion morphogenesis protein [Comamonadaceae bacterium]
MATSSSVALRLAADHSASAMDGARQQFQEQIDFFRKKLNLPTERWNDIESAAHDRAFIVAGAQKADLLADLRAAVDKSIAGQSIGDFRKQFAAAVAKSGWTGEGTTAGRAWRTRVIYQTNIATSYAAGRWAQLHDPELLAVRPFWRYIHSDSVLHPRAQHKAWGDAGLTLRHDHPFWLTHFPPNGWGCHCYVQAVRGPKAGDRTEPPDGWDTVDAKTGAPPGIDKGWAYAPGANARASLQSLVDAKLAKLSPELAHALSQEAAVVLGTQKPIQAVIKEALGADQPQAVISPNRLDTMNNMTAADFKKFFDDEPNMPARVAVASLTDADRQLYGTTATDLWLSRVSLDEHKDRHPEITFEDYLRIPEIMRMAQVWAGHKDKRYLLLMLADKAYRAAIKIDASGDEAWFLSLVVSPKQKPPKGAVRIR